MDKEKALRTLDNALDEMRAGIVSLDETSRESMHYVWRERIDCLADNIDDAIIHLQRIYDEIATAKRNDDRYAKPNNQHETRR